MTIASDPHHEPSGSGSGPPRTAIVMSGGGARGAYQVGVLRGLLDLGVFGSDGSGLDILVGSSAGAINAARLAASADRLDEAVAGLMEVWSQIRAEQVFRTDLRSLGGIGARWVRDLSFGGVLRNVQAKALLDTSPLRETLLEHVPFEAIDASIERGALYALAVPATNLYTADGVVFVDAAPDVPLWRRGRWSVERRRIRVDHVLASSAIPIFFPSVEIEGRHFGDGSIRNTAPLSSAINLGADRIVAIGVRQAGRPTEVAARHARRTAPSIAQIAGVLLDAVMLDAMEVDIEHSGRVNTSVLACPSGRRRDPFRWVDVLWLSPSTGFADLAAEHAKGVPRIVRYLMRGLGSEESTTELVSYLLFDAAFCSRLIEQGRADVESRREEVLRFFSVGPDRDEGRGTPTNPSAA